MYHYYHYCPNWIHSILLKNRNLIKYKVGDTIIPNLNITEALSQAISDFYATITNKNFICKSDGAKGYEVVEILEAANKSMKLGGTPVKV